MHGLGEYDHTVKGESVYPFRICDYHMIHVEGQLTIISYPIRVQLGISTTGLRIIITFPSTLIKL